MTFAWALIAVAAWAQPSPQGCAIARAVQLHQTGDLDGAVREYRACIAVDPNFIEARSNLGAVYARQGKFADAIAEYQQALRGAGPQFAPRLRFNLALAYYKSFQIEQAATELEATGSHEANVLLLLADCRLRLGQYRQAIDILLPLEREQADNAAVAYALGMALIRDGRVQEGQLRVDRILSRGESAEGHLLMGSALLAAHGYPKAIEEFSKAIALDPNVPAVHSLLGQGLLATGDADGAVTAFRGELERNPNDYDANFQLASILAHRGKTAESRALLEKAAQLRPSSMEARAALANGFRFETAPHDSGGLAAGAMAPAFGAFDPARVRRPVVLVFGSYTCPRFRSAAAELNRMFEVYGKQVDFRLIYIREAHPEGTNEEAAWQSTINQREGITMAAAHNTAELEEHATLCVRRLNIRFPKSVEPLESRAVSAYDAWPSRVYVIGPGGTVRFTSRLGELDFRPAALEAAIRETLDSKAQHGSSRDH